MLRRIFAFSGFLFGVVVASSGTVRADTVNFNFRGDPLLSFTKANSMTFLDSQTGLDVKVTGLVEGKPTESGSSVEVVRTGLGLGVYYDNDFPIVGDLTLDGANSMGLRSNESLVFDFTPESVVLNKLTFSLADRNDSLQLVVSKLTSTGSPIVFDLAASTNVLNYEFDLAKAGISTADRTGLIFKLTTKNTSTAVAIAGMSVDYAMFSPSGGGASSPGPAAVPLPSVAGAGVMLLGGLALKRRRRLEG